MAHKTAGPAPFGARPTSSAGTEAQPPLPEPEAPQGGSPLPASVGGEILLGSAISSASKARPIEMALQFPSALVFVTLPGVG
jgi:hypothetical protein